MIGSPAKSDRTQILQPSPSMKKIPMRFQASVVIIKGYGEGMEYAIDKAYAVIGRSANAQVRIKDDLVSREHAVIVYHEGVFLLKDLDSTNGTHMRGTSIRQRKRLRGQVPRRSSTLQFILQKPQKRNYEIA
jgi:pSer/pThr/pTyr-binding forkhead associated (FHA) protein